MQQWKPAFLIIPYFYGIIKRISTIFIFQIPAPEPTTYLGANFLIYNCLPGILTPGSCLIFK
jgi:hypothetical protein